MKISLQYFNPFNTDYQASTVFNSLTDKKQKATIIFCTAVGFLFFGIGAVGAFRKATELVSGKSILAEKVNAAAQKVLSPHSNIDSQKDSSSSQISNPSELPQSHTPQEAPDHSNDGSQKSSNDTETYDITFEYEDSEVDDEGSDEEVETISEEKIASIPGLLEKVQAKKFLAIKDASYSLLSQNIAASFSLGTSVDDGDCFYDSIAQILSRNSTQQFTISDIRNMVHDYADKVHQNNPSENWIQTKLGNNYTEFMEHGRKIKKEAPSETPVWGSNIDCLILSRILNIPIIVHEVAESETIDLLDTNFRKSENSVVVDKSVIDKEKGVYKAHVIELIPVENDYNPNDIQSQNEPDASELKPKNISDALKEIHLGLYRQHFVPCFPK